MFMFLFPSCVYKRKSHQPCRRTMDFEDDVDSDTMMQIQFITDAVMDQLTEEDLVKLDLFGFGKKTPEQKRIKEAKKQAAADKKQAALEEKMDKVAAAMNKSDKIALAKGGAGFADGTKIHNTKRTVPKRFETKNKAKKS